jgi:hypothetical protein
MKNLVIILVVLLAMLTACGSADKEPEGAKTPIPEDVAGEDIDNPPSPLDTGGDGTGVTEKAEDDSDTGAVQKVNQADVNVAARVVDVFYNIQAIGRYYDDGVVAMATIKVDAGSGSPGTGLGGLLAWILKPIRNAFPNSNGDFMVPGVPQEFQSPLPQDGAMPAIGGACPAGAKPNVKFDTEAGETVTPELIKEMDIDTIPSDMLTLPQDGPGSLMTAMNNLVPMGDMSLATASGWNNLLWKPLQDMQTTAESLMDYQMWNASGDLEQQIVEIYRQQLESRGVPAMVLEAFDASAKDGWYSGTKPTPETSLAHMDILAEMTGSVSGTVHEERDFHIPGGGEKPEFGTQTGDGMVTWEDPDLGSMNFNVDILLDQFDEEGRAIGGNVVAAGAENGYTVNIIFKPDGSKVGEVYRDGEMVGVMNMSIDAEKFENYVDMETNETIPMPGSMYYK